MCRLLLFCCCLACSLTEAGAQNVTVDTIVGRMYAYGERPDLKVEEFQADAYLRSEIITKRSNVLLHYVPGLFRMEHGRNHYLSENQVRFRYREPGEIDTRELAFYSTMPHLRQTGDRVLNRFKLSIYGTTLLTDRILSPTHRRNNRYYKYGILYTYRDSTEEIVRLSVSPRFPNTQLVEGTLDVERQTGVVRRFRLRMYYDMVHISVSGEAGREGLATLYPVALNVHTNFRLLGNRIESYFKSRLDYSFSPRTDTLTSQSADRHDLTRQCLLRIDTTEMVRSRTYFDTLRPLPLTLSEQQLYARKDSLDVLPQTSRRHKPFWRTLSEDYLFDNHRWTVGQRGRFKIPALLTPEMIEYRHSRGISVRTRLWLDAYFRGGRSLSLRPKASYYFKQRYLYWRLPVEYVFYPRYGLSLQVETGNGNRIYNAGQVEQARAHILRSVPLDTLAGGLEDEGLKLYSDLYLKTDLSFSPSAGLTLTAGVRFSDRTLIGWNEAAEQQGLLRHLRSLSPRFHVEWTPHLYFYWDRGRRIPLRSRYPTFMIDYERGVKVDRYRCEYERWELDARLKRNLYALKALYLRLGGGFYTRRGNNYFLDYSYFRDRNMPQDWEDQMAGQFHLLDARWYNESDYYVRASATYESPMLLVSRLKPFSKYIQKERLYLNLLNVQRLPFYVEMGYGMRTNAIDFGIFTNYSSRERFAVGCKFELRLFDDW